MADLRAWRLSKESELELPSGLVVRVRRVPLPDMAASGMIPAPLAETVTRLIREGGFDQGKFEFGQLAEFGAVLDCVARAAIVEPPFADAADDEHLALSELTFEDKTEIFRWANTAARALEPFRKEPGGDVAAAQPG